MLLALLVTFYIYPAIWLIAMGIVALITSVKGRGLYSAAIMSLLLPLITLLGFVGPLKSMQGLVWVWCVVSVLISVAISWALCAAYARTPQARDGGTIAVRAKSAVIARPVASVISIAVVAAAAVALALVL